jgi:hypothetical protein
VVITPVVVHAKATNELRPTPDQSAAFSAGYSQGYLGVPIQYMYIDAQHDNKQGF